VEANCSRAVWVYRQINQPANSRPVITATTMQALALVLLGRASEAEQLANSCLEAAKGLPGPVGERNSFVASCFNCLGEVYREMGRLAESEAAAREGLALRQKVSSASERVWCLCPVFPGGSDCTEQAGCAAACRAEQHCADGPDCAVRPHDKHNSANAKASITASHSLSLPPSLNGCLCPPPPRLTHTTPQDMGPEHPVVASALQTLGHVLRLRQQLAAPPHFTRTPCHPPTLPPSLSACAPPLPRPHPPPPHTHPHPRTWAWSTQWWPSPCRRWAMCCA
jgi:hypothetical protein